MLNRLFRLDQHGTTARREVAAGVTTWLTMAYIAVVNPQVLSEAGMDRGAVFVATCLAAAIACAAMGLYANYPIALAPGMGINAYFTYGVVLGMGHPWQVALGALFISGVCFVLISVFPIRAWIVDAFPRSLKMATAAGIGFFLAVIAMRNAGMVVGNEATLVGLGDVTSWSVVLAVVGLVLDRGSGCPEEGGRRADRHPRRDPDRHPRRRGELAGSRIGRPFPGPHLREVGRRRRLRRGVRRHHLRLSVHGPVRHLGDSDRGLEAGEPARRGRQPAAAETGRHRRFRRVRARVGPGDVLGHQLHRERRRREGGRAHRADLGHGRGPVPADRCSCRHWRRRSRRSRPRRRCSSSPA